MVDLVPSRSTATGVVRHIYDASHYLGHATTLAAVSFVAYLIGAVLSVDADGVVVRFFGFINPVKFGQPVGTHIVKLRPLRISLKVFADIETHVMRLKEKIPEVPEGRSIDPAQSEAVKMWNASLRGEVHWRHSDPEIIGIWASLVLTMQSTLIRETRQLVTQLRVSSPALFDQYDRVRAEAEFRLSVAFPLIFIIGVLAWKWTPLWILLLLGAVIIMQSGIRRARDATDVVAQAALAGYVTPSGWLNPKSDPMTIAHEALNSALHQPYFDDREKEVIRTVLQHLPPPPLGQQEMPSSHGS